MEGKNLKKNVFKMKSKVRLMIRNYFLCFLRKYIYYLRKIFVWGRFSEIVKNKKFCM